ncbi:outer membrane beta-barrel protein [Cognaticolwellia beringensis]|uniref:Uncharacterized protein n=1 Tax=Cognaticolwellia beringensis TaxID=1967665 RepID=A0A222G7R4_9GAMM|nr:outer membrane beta-barrel protein [Cognaticolwellia beringensis]ASP47909.1 hypothetical protein B5D82_09150 [Cognaticolwellia beringensis]
MSFSRRIAVCVTNIFFATSAIAESDHSVAFDLASEAGYIDNFLYQANNEQNTAYYTLASDLSLSLKSQQSAFNFDAKLASHFFTQFEDDDHTEFTLIPKYQFKFSQNQLLYMSAVWLNRYVYRGTGISLGEAETLFEGDEKGNKGATIGYEYGTFESQGKLNVEVSYHENKFTTRRATTSQLDTEILSIKSSFDYLLSEKTFLAFALDYEQTEHPNNTIINRDSIAGLVGIKWFTTVISELNFLIGYQQLTFDDSQLNDTKAVKWRFDYIWRPSDFTQVHIMSNRKFDESYRLTSNYRLAKNHQIDFTHDFTEYWSISTSVGVKNEKFISAQFVESEDYLFSTFTLGYQHSDRLSVQLGYHYKSLDSKNELVDYLHNKLSLKVKLKL